MGIHPVILNGKKPDIKKLAFNTGKFKPKSIHDQVFAATKFLSESK